jgi:Bacteriophage probable baseplate hub protein
MPTGPTFTVEGQDSSSLAEGLMELRIEERADGPSRCRATFGNWDTGNGHAKFLYFDQTVEFGKDLQVGKGSDELFRGRITALRGGFPENDKPTLEVLAEDRFQDLRMTRRTRTFEDISDSDVINRIASDHGLTPDVDVRGPTHPILAQLNQSDLAFLRDRARTIDVELWMEGSTLHARSHSDRNGARVKLGYGKELREFAVMADLAGQRSSLTVTGWDVSSKQGLAETVDDSAIGSELNGATSGPSLLGSSPSERTESVVHTVPLTSGEARAHALALFKRMARRFVVGRGVAETSPDLRVGAEVLLEGLGGPFSGEYYVSRVTHRFDSERGWRTEFTAERAGLGGSS